MRYLELKQRQRDEFNSFPMAFAFSDKQLAEGLAKLGVTIDEVFSIGGGGMIRKTDSPAFNDMFSRLDAELEEALKDDEFMIDAILYELGNHEYCITRDPSDTMDMLGLDLADERTHRCFVQARNQYWQNHQD